MTISEMRKKVCKRASELVRAGWKRNRSFKWAWERIKEEAKMIKASELKAGDVICGEFGDDGHYVTLTVVESKTWLFGLLIKVKYNDGRIFDIAPRPTDLFNRAA